MAKQCIISGKKTTFGAKRSHSMHQTKRKFKPNLLSKTIDLGDGIKYKVTISSKMYKKYRGLI